MEIGINFFVKGSLLWIVETFPNVEVGYNKKILQHNYFSYFQADYCIHGRETCCFPNKRDLLFP